MAAALVAMARYYDVPCGSYLGLTNSKLVDAQSGYEKAISPTLAAAAGIDFIVMDGLIDALMAFDFGQAVIDDEIASMLKRFRQHMHVGSLDGCLDEIRAAGPAGMYVDKPETLAQMKSAALLPQIADRERREVWLERGGLDAHARALNLAKQHLCRPNPALLSPEADARVRASFDATLVAGDADIPERWRTALAPAARARRGRTSRAG
jgi:trimethylamine--corrinoid protein Co-methyltransferase